MFYEDVLSCKIFFGFFEGILFCFFLRKWLFKILIKFYIVGKINNFFELFIEEVFVILFFLKNVEIVSIYEISWIGKEKMIFFV